MEIISIEKLCEQGILANSPIEKEELENAKEILLNIHKKTLDGIKNGKGPFYAEIYEGKTLISGASNNVVEKNCSICHAEINTIEEAHKKLNCWCFTEKNLTIYINAEPCIMCMGAIMWSGIKSVFYSVPSYDVEKITGFDEGFKPDWINEFKKRGIKVYGNIEADKGKEILQEYVSLGCKIYKPRD